MRDILNDKLDLPSEILLDVPKIVAIGTSEVTIENHRGIISFQNNMVRINSKLGPIKIEGSSFEILYIGSSTVTISGKFRTIYYEGISYDE